MKQEGYENIHQELDTYLHPRVYETLYKNNLTTNDLKRLYFGSENIADMNDQKLADLWGDMHFVDGIHKVVKTQVNRSSASTYLYQFTYDKGFSFIKSKMNILVKGNPLLVMYDKIKIIGGSNLMFILLRCLPWARIVSSF